MSNVLTVSEAMTVSGATRPTIISWIKNYSVDDKPLGYKRGGRWVVRTEQFVEFLRGGGIRLATGEAKKAPGVQTRLKGKKRGRPKKSLDPQKGL